MFDRLTETQSLPLVRGALAPLSWHGSSHELARPSTEGESTHPGSGRMDRWLLPTLAYIRYEQTNRTDSTTNPPTHVGRWRGVVYELQFIHVLVQRSLRSAGPHPSELIRRTGPDAGAER